MPSIWFALIVGLLLMLAGILELTIPSAAAVFPAWYAGLQIAIGFIGFSAGFVDWRRVG